MHSNRYFLDKFVCFFTAVVLSACTFNANIVPVIPASLETPSVTISKTISFDTTILNIAEGSAAVINIFLSEKMTEDVSVTLSLLGDSTALQALPLTVTVPAGTLSKSLTIQTIDDFVFGAAVKTLQLSMSSNSSTVSVGVSTVVMNITDNDLPTVVLSASAQTVAENVGTYVLTAMLNAAAVSDVTVPFTVSGTATAGVGQDYTLSASNSLLIPAGSTQVTLTITVLDDTSYESSETALITLGTPTGATLGSPSVFTLTITDNDLGAFTISGITGAADSTADNYLVGGLNPKVTWGSASGASSYDVTIYANNGTTVVCATQNTALTTYDFSSCNLVVGTVYKAAVLAKSATLTQAATNSPYSFTVNTSPVANNDGPVRIMKNSSSITLQVVTASDSATRGTVADTDADVGDTFTVTAVTQGSAGGTVTNNTTSVSYTPAAAYTGVETFTYTITDSHGATAVGTVTIHVFDTYTWTGKVSANWNVNGNWCGTITNNACNGTTGYPNSLTSTNHAAVFDGTCNVTGHNCAASINVASIAHSVRLSASYPGTLTQAAGAGNTLTVAGGGFIQAGGTFIGGSANIAFSKMSLTGGTFTSTSGNLTINPNANTVANGSSVLTATSSGTFNHNSGTLIFAASCSYNDCMNYTIDPGSSLSTNNLYFQFYEGSNGYSFSWNLATGTKFVTTGILKYEVTSAQGIMRVNSGTIDLYGNLQVFDRAYGGTSDVVLKGTANQTYSGNLTSRGPNLKIDKTAGTVTAASANFTMSSLEMIQGSFTAADGTTRIGATFESKAEGSTVFKIGVPGTTFTPSASGTLEFLASCSYNQCNNYTVDVGGSLTVNNLIFSFGEYSNSYGFSWNMIAGQKIIVNGNYTQKTITAAGYLFVNTGSIDLYGNLIVDLGSSGGTALITMKGSGNQTYTGVGHSRPAAVKIEKTGGTVTAASTDFTFSSFNLAQGTFAAPTGIMTVLPTVESVANGGVVFNIQNGTIFNANNGTLKMLSSCAFNQCTNYGISTPAGFSVQNFALEFSELSYGYDMTWNLLGTTSFVVAGNFSHNRISSIGGIITNGGSISVSGDVVFGDGSAGGTTALNFIGGNAQVVSVVSGATPWTGNVTVNKSAGSVLLDTNISWMGTTQSFSVIAGAVDMNGKNLTVRSLSLNGNTLTKNAGVLTVNGSVAGTGSLYGGTVNP